MSMNSPNLYFLPRIVTSRSPSFVLKNAKVNFASAGQSLDASVRITGTCGSRYSRINSARDSPPRRSMAARRAGVGDEVMDSLAETACIVALQEIVGTSLFQKSAQPGFDALEQNLPVGVRRKKVIRLGQVIDLEARAGGI